MKINILISLFIIFSLSVESQTQINSLGSYVWNASNEPKNFNNKLQLSFVRSSDGFPEYGTVLAGGGYSASQDGAAFQLYFPYSDWFGGTSPKIRLGLYDNQGWSNWETFFTTANANNSATDWIAKKIIAYDNVGIGRSSPNYPLHVVHFPYAITATSTNYVKGADISIQNTYSIPSGITDNGYRMGMNIAAHLFNQANFYGILTEQIGLRIQHGTYNTETGTGTIEKSIGLLISSYEDSPILEKYAIYQSNSDFRNYFAGKVGIGTTSPDHELDVVGTIRAEQIEVVQTVPSSDYVFEDDYELLTIEQIEEFVKENKHLPEVPSAAEFKENGYNIGQMDDLLLRKIEELTLYLIKQEKKFAEQAEKQKALEARIKELEKK